MLKVGDKIVYVKKTFEGLTFGKSYDIVQIRDGSLYLYDKDVCILDDKGCYWWFGQEGYPESWTMWFVTEREFIRNKNLENIL